MFPNNVDETADADGDGVGDNGDNCISDANADQLNSDASGGGDACDPIRLHARFQVRLLKRKLCQLYGSNSKASVDAWSLTLWSL